MNADKASGNIFKKIDEPEPETKTILYREGLALPPDHWYSIDPYAPALAKAIYEGIEKIGVMRFSKIMWTDVYTYIDRHLCYEYSELSQNQKTAFGEFMQKTLTRILGWEENEGGLDVRIYLLIDGNLAPFDADIKCSSNSKNKGKKKEEMGKKRRGRPPKMGIPDQWQISRECYKKINILISVDTYGDNFSIGILYCGQEGFLAEIKEPEKDKVLGGPQRDGKRSVTQLGKDNIVWILHKQTMPPNPLLPRMLQIQKIREEYSSSMAKIIEGYTDEEMAMKEGD